jgi:hypothetical protein
LVIRFPHVARVRCGELAQAADVRIWRHLKIKSDANPFDPSWRPYFDERKLLKKLPPTLHKLLRKPS